MTAVQLSESLGKLIGDDNYAQQLSTVQQKLYADLLKVVKDLELDGDTIVQNQANRQLLRKAEVLIEKLLRQSELKSSTESEVKKISKINSLSQSYFNNFDGFKPNRDFISGLQSQTINQVNTRILQDGLKANFIEPLKGILNRNVNTGGSYTGFLQELKNYIVGTEGQQGQLVRYANTWLKDTLFDYSRSYQQAVTVDLKLEFYVYLGGLIKDSRDFCKERAGNYYHHKEIEDWASLDWAGKRKGTTKSSIFIFAGGYNCSHSVIPVSNYVVPEEVIERNVKNGNYQKGPALS